MEFGYMLINYIYEKASLLSSIPFFIAMPMKSVSKNNEEQKQDQEQEFEQDQGLGPVSYKPNHNNKTLPIIALISSLTLAGCTGSTYTSHFDCPMGEGAGCASISRVNKMIDRREIDLDGDDASLREGASSNKGATGQVYVYYGPDQLSRLIPTNAVEGN